MASNRGRTGPAWNQARTICFNRSQTCARCHQPIDMTLSGRHPRGPQAGHIIDLHDGGTNHPDNLQTEHRRCNIAAGNKRRHERKRAATLIRSRDW